MKDNELNNLIYGKIQPIFEKLTDDEIASVLLATSEAYKNGYNQALLDIENATKKIEDYYKAKNN
jgi:hypothetical protein